MQHDFLGCEFDRVLSTSIPGRKKMSSTLWSMLGNNLVHQAGSERLFDLNWVGGRGLGR
jgi:hypothetical protein